jgi:ATP-dependent Lon protease
MTNPDYPTECPAIVLYDSVILPHMAAPFEIENETMLAAIREAQQTGYLLLLFAHKQGDEERPLIDNKYLPIGVLARVQTDERLGNSAVILHGETRAALGECIQERPFLQYTCQPLPDPDTWDEETNHLKQELLSLLEVFIDLSPNIPDSLIEYIRSIENPGALADHTAYTPEYTRQQRVNILTTTDLKERLHLVISYYKERVAYAQIQAQIREQARAGLEASQREFFLREQMRAIRQELGEDDDIESTVSEYEKRIEEAGMTAEAQKEAYRELRRLEKIPPQSPEFSVIKTYLDWLCDLPWSKLTTDDLDISRARAVLDEDHYGLQEIKDRILEFLAVRKLALERGQSITRPEDRRGAILCFVGPPGVGKTSLGRSIARALGREFTRMSLGGMRDEAEIRGHRRTYIGAMPGRIIQAIRRAGTRNPVFMLDEVDKIGTDWRGDPASALLEVLDPEQNSTFRDYYLDVDFDLSQVMFITTANRLEPIPLPLQDRMEILRLDGYVEPEKIAIAKQYLIPRQLKANSLYEDEVVFTDGAIGAIISDHTREAGVRQLEREIGRVARKIATRIAEGTAVGPVTVDEAMVRELLGKPRFFAEVAERTVLPGVATGLAVTETGGDLLFIEATKMPGNGRLILTGQLGDVLKESANLALSYVQSRAESLGINTAVFENHNIHVHIPAGAVPKDGPSAGVAIVTAIISLLTDTAVASHVGMTGEITLRGRVLPVGGIKRKVLAAHRAGLKTVLIPKRNEHDLDDLPDEARELNLVLVETIDEVLAYALPALQTK